MRLWRAGTGPSRRRWASASGSASRVAGSGGPSSVWCLTSSRRTWRPKSPPASTCPSSRGRAPGCSSSCAPRAIPPPRLTAALITCFAVLAFLITAIGTGGVVGSSVNERWREIGIRAALGARRKDVVGLVLRQGMALVLAGLLFGVLGSMLLTKLMSSLLFGVEPTDVVTFVLVALVLVLVVGLACFVPARRATRVDPI